MIDIEGRLRRLATAVGLISTSAERGTDNAALAAVWTAALATALANYTAERAGYLDQLDFNLQEALATIAGYIDTEVGAIQDDLDNETDGLGALKALIDAITAAGPTNAQMETARDAIIAEVDANETKIDDLDDDLATHATALSNHNTALTNHESSQSTHRTALTNHESSQSTHRAVLVDIHDTDLPAVKTVADDIAVLVATTVAGKPQVMVHDLDLISLAAGTYALVTAVTQDVIIESITFYCERDLSVEGGGFSGISIQTDATTPIILISQAEGVKANLTAESQLHEVRAVLLKPGTYIELTTYGGAISGVTTNIQLVVTYKAVVSGGYIA